MTRHPSGRPRHVCWFPAPWQFKDRTLDTGLRHGMTGLGVVLVGCGGLVGWWAGAPGSPEGLAGFLQQPRGPRCTQPCPQTPVPHHSGAGHDRKPPAATLAAWPCWTFKRRHGPCWFHAPFGNAMGALDLPAFASAVGLGDGAGGMQPGVAGLIILNSNHFTDPLQQPAEPPPQTAPSNHCGWAGIQNRPARRWAILPQPCWSGAPGNAPGRAGSAPPSRHRPHWMTFARYDGIGDGLVGRDAAGVAGLAVFSTPHRTALPAATDLYEATPLVIPAQVNQYARPATFVYHGRAGSYALARQLEGRTDAGLYAGMTRIRRWGRVGGCSRESRGLAVFHQQPRGPALHGSTQNAAASRPARHYRRRPG